MTIYNQNSDGLFSALDAISRVPDEKFSDMLHDPQRMDTIRDQFYKLKVNRNVGDERASKRYFHADNDRDLLNRAIVYYKARLDWTKPKNQGLLKKALSCFGQEDGIAWITDICQAAGISFYKPTETIKTEQEKEAEQDAGRAAVRDHLSGKRKPVTNQSETIPETIGQQIQDQTEAIPEIKIGTPFLANGMQFVLYRPSEAYEMPERSAIIDNYFYADTISLLYGQAGSFKTWFALWEGVSLALGKELCGMPINDGDHRVLYISLEMTAKGLADRLDGMTKDLTVADREKVNDNFVIVSAENTDGMKATDEFLTALAQLCDDQDFDVIYIDSFADFIAGRDIRSENEMTAIIDKLRSFVLKHHVSFRIIHHGTKPTQDTNGSMAGIHTIRDLVDYVFLIKADTQNEIKITSDMQDDRSAKSRYSAAMKMTLKFIADAGSVSFKQISDNETSNYIEKLSELLKTIEDNPGISAGELRSQFKNYKGLTRMIDGAINAGSIIMQTEKAGNGSPKKCFYPAQYVKGS